MFDIFVRRIEENDSNEILLWRNDVTTRAMSKDENIIKLQDHNKWFKNIINDNNYMPLICIDLFENLKVAFVNFKINNTVQSSVISVNINPLHRNKGYSSLCLIKSIEFFKKRFVKCEHIIAEIKDINLSSIKSFEKIGFKKINSSSNGISSYKFITKNNN